MSRLARPRAMLVAVAAAALLVAPGMSAQVILLRLHPHVGDTLHTRLEQRTEVSGTRAGSSGAVIKPVTTSVSLNSRTIVRESSGASTLVVTIVDSADIHSSDAHAVAQVADAERVLKGQVLVLRLASDGTVESAQDARGAAVTGDLARSMAAMPAVFPQRPVNVGDQWMREMPLPPGGPLGARGSGHVIAAFRLDSLGHGGSIAYVSMQGDIKPDSTSQGVQLSGAVTGAMQIDRLRGWLTDSRFTILLRSFVTPPASTGLAPMHFVTRVTQRLRTMDKR